MEFRRKTKEEILEEKLIERYKDFYILEMMKLVEDLAIQRAKEDVKRLLKGDEILMPWIQNIWMLPQEKY